MAARHSTPADHPSLGGRFWLSPRACDAMTFLPANAASIPLPEPSALAGYHGSPPIGCQTYTWEMLGDVWIGRTADILDAIAAAGYSGLEITRRMAGEFQTDPAGLAAACQARGLMLTTLALSSPSGFTDPARAAA